MFEFTKFFYEDGVIQFAPTYSFVEARKLSETEYGTKFRVSEIESVGQKQKPLID
jgi:hypothetical protein